jgi:class 3 adenylate cyclase/tetratricopeptide (TPR) repeat protein
MDVAAWLQDLGLERYVPAFRDNDIDAEVLRKLTAEDLISIGVTSVGHRRKLLDAVASLGMAVPATVVRAPAPGAPAQVDAERRQLTVMFCDLVGSTALSTRHDPEDLRELIGDYHRAVSKTVGRFDGFVAKYMGDGVLIYFGYPQAHEDDAERAVRAGLAVIEAVGQLPAREDLSVRLGIATGLAVVGDLIGEGAAQERGVVGETPNLAARLQALSTPNTLVIGEATRRQIGGLFDLEELGPQQLAGFVEPQRAWRILSESGVLSRFEALRSDASPLVGRDEELELLRRRWDQARNGDGRVVLVAGEPGIGKSRLTAAIAETLAGEPHTRLRYFCSPHHQDSALYPFIAQLERAAGFVRDDTAAQKRAKLEALLLPDARDMTDLTLIAELLSLPNDAAALNVSPQRKREMLFDALLRHLEAVSRRQSTLMVFEDAHWVDPTSRELLDLTVERVSRLPVLLVVTFRPEFQPGWDGRPHVTMLALNRLGGREVTALVAGLARNTPLCSEVVTEIVERTDGVPLFVEELTKAVLERADQDQGVAAVLSASPMPALAVPPTLHASLMARLDRLGGPAKEVAQVGAVLGREFTYELIAPVAQCPESVLQAALALLTEAGLLFCRGVPPHAFYMFKHALVQDAAYGTLLRVRRQELHARVAAVLQQQFANLVERQPELLAHHLTGAGNVERAVDQWLLAGRFAAGRSTHLEAIHHFDHGLALVSSQPQGPARDAREADLHLARGLSLFTTEGFVSRQAAQAYARASELAERQGDSDRLFTAVYGLWQSNSGSGSPRAAKPYSARLLELTASESDNGLRLQAHHSGWTTGLASGELAVAYEHCAVGRRLYDPERHAPHRFLFGGHDPGVCAHYQSAHIEWLMGVPERALASIANGLSLARQIGHPLSLELALIVYSVIHVYRGEPEPALNYVDAVEKLAAEQRLGFAREPCFMRGAALIAQGAVEEGISVLRRGLDTAVGRGIWRPWGLSLLSYGLVLQGGYADALVAIREGLERVEATGERQWESELYRLEGLALLRQNEVESGQAALHEALRVARQQQAKAWELRAATTLARFWGEQGRRAEARELLAPVYNWFAEGFDTADLKQAKALLDALA